LKTILVDDEPIMLSSFVRNSTDIPGLHIVGMFQYPEDALAYAEKNPVELAVLDIAMSGMDGLELARRLREIEPKLLIVFITAYDEYVQKSNEVNADYYIVKPYNRETIEQMVNRMLLLSGRLKKKVSIQMFGRFMVYKDGVPVALRGKAKEILALIATKRGKEISNEEIYSTIWENREYSNIRMKVYYNALKRLKDSLEKEGMSSLLISTSRGQLLNTAMFDCDYYEWQDNNSEPGNRFEGEFLPEYSWGEYTLGNILSEMKYL